MKLIIDIDKEEYEECKQYLAEGVFTNWEGIIAKGAPYEERPQGEWLKSDVPESVLAKCSICGFDCGAYTHNFCPNCGADMRGDEG